LVSAAKQDTIVVITIIISSAPYIFFLPNTSAKYPKTNYPINVPINALYFNNVSDVLGI